MIWINPFGVLQRVKGVASEKETCEAVALNVAAHRLENLVHDRRIGLAAQQKAVPRAS